MLIMETGSFIIYTLCRAFLDGGSISWIHHGKCRCRTGREGERDFQLREIPACIPGKPYREDHSDQTYTRLTRLDTPHVSS